MVTVARASQLPVQFAIQARVPCALGDVNLREHAGDSEVDALHDSERQEALATGVSATGTEEEGGKSTGRYFRIFSRYIGRRGFSGRTQRVQEGSSR